VQDEVAVVELVPLAIHVTLTQPKVAVGVYPASLLMRLEVTVEIPSDGTLESVKGAVLFA
jgi:hypothetical protein